MSGIWIESARPNEYDNGPDKCRADHQPIGAGAAARPLHFIKWQRLSRLQNRIETPATNARLAVSWTPLTF